MKKVVLSLHGIRTRGVWQKELAPVLAKYGFIPYPLDYGNFPAMFLLAPSLRQGKVEWLRQEYERIAREEQVNRLSIIAHTLMPRCRAMGPLRPQPSACRGSQPIAASSSDAP